MHKKLLLIIPFLYLFILLLQTDLSLLEDLGRHLKMGEIILQCNCVPDTNLFSYTDKNFPVVNHEWLTQVIFYIFYKYLGLGSLLYLKIITYFATISILIFLAKKKSSYFWLSIVATLSITIISTRFRVRPEMFSYLFIALYLLIFYFFDKTKNYKYLLITIPVQLMWVNMHLFFIFGPFILLTYLIEKYLDSKKLDLKLLGFLGIISSINLINPAGIKGALLPLTFHSNYAITVEENAGLLAAMKNLSGTIFTLSLQIYVFELLLIIFLITLPLLYKKNKFSDSTNAVFTGILGVKYIRTISLFGIYLIVTLPKKLTEIEVFLKKKTESGSINIIKVLVLIITIIIALTHVYGLKKYNIIQFGFRPYAENAANFIVNNNIKGPIFNNYHIGNYLIYALYPNQSIFIDARPEMYSSEFLEKYQRMLSDPNYFNEQDKKYDLNLVVIGLNYENPAILQPFIISLLQNPEWVPIYADGNVTMFIKKSEVNKNIINKYQIKVN